MEVIEVERPDHRALREHLSAGEFLLAAHLGRWRVVKLEWPHLTIEVEASPRGGAPSCYGLRFACQGYPQQAVTGRLWDLEADAPLPAAHWPKGRSRVAAVFRPDWKDGACLYLPCDRLSMEGHANWPSEYPAQLWRPERGIIGYLEAVYELLQSNDYEGIRGG
jgi:hypothetical protein